jgi:hypothetical protein
MDGTEVTRRRRRWGGAGLVALGLVAGGILAGSQIASAASSSNGSGSSANAPARMDPAKMTHGPGETLLIDGTATKVRNAALAKFPGATVIRVETDSGGAAYEAHLQKADGSSVTVKFDKQFNVTATQDGFGSGAPGAPRSRPN